MPTATQRRTGGPLTPQAQEFARLVASGRGIQPAYMQAYSRQPGTERTAATAACALIKKPAVAAEIDRLRNLAESADTLTRLEKREALARIVRDEGAPIRDRLQAIQLDNKMAGHDAPVQVQVGVSLIEQLHQRTGRAAVIDLEEEDADSD